jgi:hypothetical protein
MYVPTTGQQYYSKSTSCPPPPPPTPVLGGLGVDPVYKTLI